MPTRPSRSLILALVLAAATAAGCWPGYRPGGAGASIDEYTYESTVEVPKTIKLIDWTTNTTIWTLDIPPGQQAVVRFYDNHDPKNATRPALMRWQLFEIGREMGHLGNAIPAPGKDQRRVDWFKRDTPAATPAPEPVAAPAK